MNGGLSVYGVSDGKTAPVYAIYNLGQFPRAEVVRLTTWDIDPAGAEMIEAAAADGTALPCQLFEKGDYWGHTFATFAVPVSVQGLGYTTVTLREGGGAERDEKADRSGGAYQKGFGHECSYASYERSPEGLENEFLDLELDTITGGIRSLVHRESGTELVRSGAALLEYSVERAKPMSAWQVEHHSGALEPKVVAMKRGARGPNVATIEVTVSVESSRFTITYRLERNDPRLYIDISGTWMERGDDRKGSPTLTFALPTSLTDVRTVYEIPFGSIERDLRHGEEVPALRWAHVTGMIGNGAAGVLVVSDCKHGFSFDRSTLRLTLIRSAFEPDPLPEIGRHDVRIAVVPHAGAMTRIDEARHAVSATEPLLVVQTDAHDGGLPADGRFLEIEGGAVLSCVKRRNTGGGIVVRLYNPSDAPMKAGIGFGSAMGRAVAKATALDVLEREIGALPVSKGKVSVGLDPHAIVTLSIE